MALFLLSIAIDAQPRRLTCGTGDERPSRAPRPFATHAAGASELRDGLLLLETTDDIAYGSGETLDLAGKTLVFEPMAPTRYRRSVAPLAYVEPSTAPRHRYAWPDTAAVRVDLPFAFPFHGRVHDALFLTPYHAIHFEAPPEPHVSDLTGADLLDTLARRTAVLSPLLVAPFVPWTDVGFPDVFVEHDSDAVRITWRNLSGANFGIDVQAELRADGRVAYSYREARNFEWGTPALVPDLDELLAASAPIATLDDPDGDVGVDRIDLQRIRIFRIADALLVRFEVAESLAGSTEQAEFRIAIQGQRPYVAIVHGGSTTILHRDDHRPHLFDSPRIFVEGSTVDVMIPQERDGSAHTITFSASYADHVDTAAATFILGDPPRGLDVDLTAAPSEHELPFGETFLLPELDPEAVWAAAKTQHGFRDDEFDAVAIYQTFFTNIITYATAYATVGNPQVSGIWPPGLRSDPAGPKRPNLMHLNQYRYGTDVVHKARILMHELGHRWLFLPLFGPDRSNALAPSSSHPGGHVHTPAAFPVAEERECSVMGGAYFDEPAPGTFTARVRWNGYSWMELYLMGLATPEETQPLFYLDEPSAPLPSSYWPPDGVTVTATKRTVGVGQLIEAMGPRSPAAAASPREFKVLFVLVTKPGEAIAPVDLAYLRAIRATFEERFAKATGGRARVDTGIASKAPKRRATRP